jgi:hypothetical protein
MKIVLKPEFKQGKLERAWLRETFECENCHECGRGERAHVCVSAALGPFALCRPTVRTAKRLSPMQAAVFLILTACGGAPFTIVNETPGNEGGVELADASSPTGETPDAGAPTPHDDGGKHPKEDAGSDVDAGSPLEDAGLDAPPDVAVDAAPTCTPTNGVTEYTWTCGVRTNEAPYTFCIANAPQGSDQGAMPPACTACEETYTCACLIAHGNPCGLGMNGNPLPPTSCTFPKGEGPTVTCP